jgi:two-component system chemotaxis response regulator CheY
MLKQELSRLGHEVSDFGDGPKALEYLSSQTPALVISDVNMAPMDGFAFVKEVRERLPKERLPVLFFTTEASDQVRQHGREVGANGWLTKPLVPGQLQKALEHLLRKPTHTPG